MFLSNDYIMLIVFVSRLFQARLEKAKEISSIKNPCIGKKTINNVYHIKKKNK